MTRVRESAGSEGQSEQDPWQLLAARADGSWHGSKPMGNPFGVPGWVCIAASWYICSGPSSPSLDSRVLADLPLFLCRLFLYSAWREAK